MRRASASTIAAIVIAIALGGVACRTHEPDEGRGGSTRTPASRDGGGAGATSATASGPDLSTDEAVRVAYNTATGSHCPKVDECVCIQRSTEFSGVIVVGGFANDRGCAWEGIFDGGRYTTLRDSAGPLARAGWATASPTTRVKLATDWAQEILQLRMEVVAPDAFKAKGAPKFDSMHAASQPDGGVILRGWVAGNSGMRRGPPPYDLIELHFAKDGSVEGVTGISNWEAPEE